MLCLFTTMNNRMSFFNMEDIINSNQKGDVFLYFSVVTNNILFSLHLFIKTYLEWKLYHSKIQPVEAEIHVALDFSSIPKLTC